MKKRTITLVLILITCFTLSAHAVAEKKEIKVLILPKIEIGTLDDNVPGEAEYFYHAYLEGGDVYEIAAQNKLYVKDGIAMLITSEGKTNAAISSMSVLTDPRFDFSNALILSVGCAGSAPETTVMGDVFISTAVFDYDLGHHADPRELTRESDVTWFHNPDYDSSSIIFLSKDLTDRVFELVKDIKPETTPVTRHYMATAFDNAEWATRDPVVMKGTTSSADNFFKGKYDLANCLYMTEHYNCPDPYVADDMEDIAIGVLLKRLGMLDRYVIVRGSVNMLLFMNGDTPESLWGDEISFKSDDNKEVSDIFPTGIKNIFEVGKVIIDAYLDGSLVL